jgi:hypothetical protein
MRRLTDIVRHLIVEDLRNSLLLRAIFAFDLANDVAPFAHPGLLEVPLRQH